ncbi:hypothetical protein E2C01_015231 [Portunus trituberculatus]|uniref:Uncharacterized protein n=1 Tax=Portunus trituberculatus TaxID=210409 RepID=A0A5B7DKS6_PORTR|nr:hypothetical protein [Portunus trituberculatus]
MPHFLLRPRCIKLSSSSHSYSVQLSGKLWNSLPASLFLSSYNLTSFKFG